MYALPLLLALLYPSLHYPSPPLPLTSPATLIDTFCIFYPHWDLLYSSTIIYTYHSLQVLAPLSSPRNDQVYNYQERASALICGHSRCMITVEFSVIKPLYYSYHPISSSFFATWAGAFDVAVMGKKSRLTMNTKEKRRNMIGDDGKYGWRGRQTNL